MTPNQTGQSKLLKSLLAVIVLMALIAPAVWAQAPVKKQDATAGQALSLLFDSHRAPPAKSMGLLQGNFLDAVDVSGSLQLALVIDVSESMEDQLKSIQENMRFLVDDLNRILDGSLEIAIVTYSDIGDKQVPVSVHSQDFADAAATSTIIQGLSTSTGKPYFPEAADLGIHRALSSLPWSDEPDVERWVLMIGDAPPYEPSFADDKTGAKRWYETDLLVDLANQKGIKIHCLLCNSRESEKESFESLLDDTRSFMAQLSSDTGGLMLDMSYEQVRSALAESAQRVRTEYIRIGHISEADIQDALKTTDPGDANQRLRVVVLPFLPLEDMTFFHQRPEVQIATELRNLLKQLPDTRVVQPRQLETQLTRLKSEGIPVTDWPQALCFRLRAQLIITGRARNAQRSFAAEVEVRGSKSKAILASTKLTAKPQDLARQIIGQLSQTRNPSPEIAAFCSRLKKFSEEQQIDASEMGALSKLDATERLKLLAGLEALEQSTGFAQGDLTSVSLLQSAEENLRDFLEGNPQHPYALMMLASAQFNLASAYEVAGANENAKAKFTESTQALQRAFQSRNDLVDELLKLELEGDYHLMVRKQYQASIDRYRTIVQQSEQSPLNSSLHAHWMLAGIRSGDWGVESNSPQIMDSTAARNHVIQILAFWPDSYQARLIRRTLMWDPQNNKSRSPYLARQADQFASN